jgi:regulatory protein
MDINPHDKQHIRAAAFNYLSRREYARRELAAKLCGKGFAAEAVEAVLQQLEEEKLLSDNRFSEAYVRAYQAKGQGPSRLKQGLRQRGVDQNIIDDTLAENETDWQAEARRVRAKRFGETLPDTPTEYARQARFLTYRGFTSEQVRCALKQE